MRHTVAYAASANRGTSSQYQLWKRSLDMPTTSVADSRPTCDSPGEGRSTSSPLMLHKVPRKHTPCQNLRSRLAFYQGNGRNASRRSLTGISSAWYNLLS